jgi:glycosyltransferase involved in cell wall biosynthesis
MTNKLQPDRDKLGLLLIGAFLSAQSGTKGISELLAELLRSRQHHVITVSSRPNRAYRLIDIAWHIWAKRNQYQVAHIDLFSGSAFIWAIVAVAILRALKKPHIITMRGGALPEFARRRPSQVSQLLTRAEVVTTPSHYLLREFQQYRDDIQYLPNGLDIIHYPFTARTKPQPKLCWLRAFHTIYNPALAVRTIAILRKTFPDIHLDMIGPDKEDGSFAEANKLIVENGLEKHIRIVGPVPKADVPTWLQQGDIYLNTTRYESFGVAVMEAAAVGLPVVTTNVGEIPYLWSDGEDALLIPNDDPEAMAGAVHRILTEPGLAERLSRNGRRKSEQFDWTMIMPQWESLFAQLARRA